MSELITMTKVFIIESPSFIDLIENRKEGDALGKILDLAKIDNVTFSVSDVETLRIAYNRISEEVNRIKGDLGAVHLHFSMHGSKDGVALSDKTFLDWKSFYKLLKDFNDSIGYISLPSGLQIAPTYLAFSVCDGLKQERLKNMVKSPLILV